MARSPATEAAVAPAEADGPMPDWMVDCDLVACQVVQDVSAQIVEKCKAFGVQLGGVCGRAIEQLPQEKSASDSSALLDDSSACMGFLSAFCSLSQALLCLAGDLESTVTLPLQTAIATLTEESVGRVKHWRQVRGQLIELQARYGRTHKRSVEARGKLESGKSWFPGGKSKEKAASEQHAAMCDLARCEEELRESEASLRRLEDESRERLRQLNQEKNALMQGALTKGARSLTRLRVVVDKAPATPPEQLEAALWQGVMPQATSCTESTEKAADCETVELAPPPSEVVPADPGDGDAARKEAEEAQQQAAAAAADPSSKYLQGSGKFPHVADAEFSELAELAGFSSEEEEDVATRAKNWSPPARSSPSSTVTRRPSTGGGSSTARRSLVFQNSSTPILAARQSPSTPSPAASTSGIGGSANSTSPSAVLLQSNPLLQRVAAAAATAAEQPRAIGDPVSPTPTAPQGNTRMQASDISPSLDRRNSAPAVASSASPPSAASPPLAVGMRKDTVASPTAIPETTLQREDSSASLAAKTASMPRRDSLDSVPRREASSLLPRGLNSHSSFDDEDDEDEESLSAGCAPSAEPRVLPDISFQVTPVIAEDPRKCFERYTKRLPERMRGVTETAWDKLQARAAEQPAGAFVGKVDFFWLLRPGETATPEQATGLACVQFVQGFAANFARILHLSVVAADAPAANSPDMLLWRDLLPAALLEVRTFVLSNLDVSSLRAIVLAGEDDEGRIYVDGDVEAAYQQSRFRWFQLTQSLRRTRQALTGKKLKKTSRFLVLHSSRSENDPMPARKSIAHKPALLLSDQLQGDRSTTSPDSSAVADDAAGGSMPSFSSI